MTLFNATFYINNFTQGAPEDTTYFFHFSFTHIYASFPIRIEGNFHIRNIHTTSDIVSRRARGFTQTCATTKEVYSLIYTSAIIARLAPSALSIYFDHLTYLSFRLKKILAHTRTRIERFVRDKRGKLSREVHTR